MSTGNIPGAPTIVLVHGAFADASSWPASRAGDRPGTAARLSVAAFTARR